MNKTENELAITPETRISALLEQYPELEDVLISLSPAFGKLRNPLLRKTVGKIATLRQVAKMGNVPLTKLINNLRVAARVSDVEWSEEERLSAIDRKPDWVGQLPLAKTFDARPVIESGGHPLNTVVQDLQKLTSGSMYILITPFLPTPLLDVVARQGFAIWSDQSEPGLVKNYFAKVNQ